VFGAGQGRAAQRARQFRTAIAAGVAMRVNGVHLLDQLLVVVLALARWALPRRVITGGGHLQGFAEFSDVKTFPHGINQRIPLGGSSESMLIAFFRISRWRRRYSFSRCKRRISPAASARGTSLRPCGCAAAPCATCPLPRALYRQDLRELAETPSSAATCFNARPLLSSLFPAP